MFVMRFLGIIPGRKVLDALSNINSAITGFIQTLQRE